MEDQKNNLCFLYASIVPTYRIFDLYYILQVLFIYKCKIYYYSRNPDIYIVINGITNICVTTFSVRQ